MNKLAKTYAKVVRKHKEAKIKYHYFKGKHTYTNKTITLFDKKYDIIAAVYRTENNTFTLDPPKIAYYFNHIERYMFRFITYMNYITKRKAKKVILTLEQVEDKKEEKDKKVKLNLIYPTASKSYDKLIIDINSATITFNDDTKPINFGKLSI
jgi:hypothetical protein